MFAQPHPAFVPVQPNAPWQESFKAALAPFQPFNPASLDEALAKSLDEWTTGSAKLAADPALPAVQRYCIRQASLWRIYAAIESNGKGADISRTIYNRACAVVEETPQAARPADLSFMQGENLIRKTLEHLRRTAVFYQEKTLGDQGQESTAAIPPSPGFRKTTVVEAGADPGQADSMLLAFLNDNRYVRTILLGDDPVAAAGAVIVDNRLNIPGGGIDPGRGLWVKSYTLLRPQISTWLGAAIPHEYDQVRCIFISPRGKPSSFLAITAPLDPANVSSEILDAADADEPV